MHITSQTVIRIREHNSRRPIVGHSSSIAALKYHDDLVIGIGQGYFGCKCTYKQHVSFSDEKTGLLDGHSCFGLKLVLT